MGRRVMLYLSCGNNQKVFSPTTVLSVMGIVINIDLGTFSIEDNKLHEIHILCEQGFCEI